MRYTIPLQKKKMILYGILHALIYLALPLIAIYILDIVNVVSFSEGFVIGIIVFGIIGVIMSMLKHAYPEDTAKNSVMRFLVSIYRAIYIFYLFGGFTLGVELGYYQIQTETITVTLGLKFLAWLLLILYGINSLKYLLRAIELRGTTEGSLIHQERIKISLLFKVFGIVAIISISAYLVSIVYSGLRISPGISQIPITTYDDSGTPLDYSDDDYSVLFPFSLQNRGLYALKDVLIRVEIWTTPFSTNWTTLPPFRKVGESIPFYSASFSTLRAASYGIIPIYFYQPYLQGLSENYATLQLKFYLSTYYAGIYIDTSLTLDYPWEPLNNTFGFP
ncbi:MAG: membrane protein of unknown function [Promethearchaeota archaeon]|nr:MAG: membrane protein of unknown function [Candidatus Lokiarchaeota archaeon]